MGKTRKDAQQQAAENALHNLAGKLSLNLDIHLVLMPSVSVVFCILCLYSPDVNGASSFVLPLFKSLEVKMG